MNVLLNLLCFDEFSELTPLPWTNQSDEVFMFFYILFFKHIAHLIALELCEWLHCNCNIMKVRVLL